MDGEIVVNNHRGLYIQVLKKICNSLTGVIRGFTEHLRGDGVANTGLVIKSVSQEGFMKGQDEKRDGEVQ